MPPSTSTAVVLCAPDDARPPGLDALGERMTVRYTDATGLADAVPGADVILVWDFFSHALADAWDRCDRLRWVHVTAAGVDAVLFDALRTSDVTVTNAHGVFDRPIAEYVLGAMLADVKRTHESHDLQRQGIWRHRETRTLAGAHALVVGAGGIGREIARLLHAVGMRVTGAARTPRDGDDDFDRIVASPRLAQACGDVDYLVNAAPLTAATRGLVDARVLAALPATSYVINIGRGPTVVERDLLAALDAGRLRGACLDVFDTEPLPPDSPLWHHPRVVVTPHMSGDIAGWRDALAAQFVDLAERYLSHRPLYNVVDKRLGFVAA